MKFILKLGQFTFFLFVSASLFGQSKYGFLKSTAAPFIIRDLSEEHNSNWSTTTLLTSNTYFYLFRTDSSKFQIGVTAYKYFGKKKEAPTLSTFTVYVDSSKIVQFDRLNEVEKKERIMEVLDKYLKVFGEYKNDEKFERKRLLFYEGTFSAMRQELIKYWAKNKDERLLVKYFEILYCCTGDDGMDSRTVGSLFCLAPYDFCDVLNKQTKKHKEYIVYSLTGGGIDYHVTYNTEHKQNIDEVVNKYKDLLYSLVK